MQNKNKKHNPGLSGQLTGEYANYSDHTASCFSLALFCKNVFASRSKAVAWPVPSGSRVFPSGDGLICPDSTLNSSPMRAASPVINFQ